MIRIPGYELLETLGTGASATVYRAVQQALGREVALKVLAPGMFGEEETRARFLREARVQARLSHPRLLALYDAGFAGGQAYLAIELVQSGTLRARLQGTGALPVAEAVRLGRQIAEGLAAAHGAGVIHRDLKPENVLLTADGAVKLADFGLAKPLGDTRTFQSVAGLVIGTPGYLAPEVVEGGLAGPAADLYALGVTLYEMAAGARPFPQEDLAELFRAQKEASPEWLGRVRAEVPEALSSLVARCLAADPGQRPSSAEAVALELGLPSSSAARPGASRTVSTRVVQTQAAAKGLRTEISTRPGATSQRPSTPGARALTLCAGVLAAGLLSLGLWRSGPGRDERLEPVVAPEVTSPGNRVGAGAGARLPRITRAAAGTDRAMLLLSDATTAASRVVCQALPAGGTLELELAAGERTVSIAGLSAETRHRVTISSGTQSVTTELTTLARASWSDAAVIAPGLDAVRMSVAVRGQDVTAAALYARKDERLAVRLLRSADAGLTWAVSDAPGPSEGTADLASLAYSASGLVLAGCRKRTADTVETTKSSLQFLDDRGDVRELQTAPRMDCPGPALLSLPGGGVLAIHSAVGSRQLFLANLASSPLAETRSLPAMEMLPYTTELHVARAGSRWFAVTRRLDTPDEPRQAHAAIASGDLRSRWSAWQPLSEPGESTPYLDLAGLGEVGLVASDSENEGHIVRLRRLAEGETRFSAGYSPFEALRERSAGGGMGQPESRTPSLAVAGGKFHLAAVVKTESLARDLLWAGVLMILSSGDGLSWSVSHRIQIGQTGKVRCMRLAATGGSLLALVATRNNGVFAVRLPVK